MKILLVDDSRSAVKVMTSRLTDLGHEVVNAANGQAGVAAFADTAPDLVLMGVEIGHAEFWNVTESKMVQLAKMAKAAITGEPPKSLGEHKELNLG